MPKIMIGPVFIRAYGVTIVNCTEALCTKLEVKDIYCDITSSGYIIELLKLIKNKSRRYHSHKYLPQSMHDSLRKFNTTYQLNSITCSE